jgi:hypothetical protein
VLHTMSTANAKAQQKRHPQHCFVITTMLDALLLRFCFNNYGKNFNAQKSRARFHLPNLRST